ncbi:MAG: SH3 domain-containing protein [Polyangiaceae bacterium]|nr:SH3 domain-containing protein [Polyangiaceae bacterium]
MTSPAPARTARWLDAVTTVLVTSIVVVLAVAVSPSLLRAGESAASPPRDFPPPVHVAHPRSVHNSHPNAFPFSDDDGPQDVDEPPGARAGARSPNSPLAAPPGVPGGDRDDADDNDLGLKSGVITRRLQLRDRATSAVVQVVEPGQTVSILRDDGQWVLLVLHRPGDLVTGWALRSELSLR